MFEPGNQEWRKRQTMTEAMRIEMVQYEALEKQIKMGEAPRAIARKAIEAALNGEPWAIAFVYDRLDGKALQRTENKHEHRAAESLSEEHARLVAESFIDALKHRGEGGGAEQPDCVHSGVPAGLPGRESSPSDRESA